MVDGITVGEGVGVMVGSCGNTIVEVITVGITLNLEFVGAKVGIVDVTVGTIEGAEVGRSVGAMVGLIVGDLGGEKVLVMAGDTEGKEEDVTVGSVDGRKVGFTGVFVAGDVG